MPIKVQNNLPAKKIMEQENIFMMDETRATTQNIRPLYIAVLNLMPLKEDTEVQLLRSLSNTPLQIEITFLTTASYIGKNTTLSHLNEFYKTYDDVKERKFDGLIITGAPVEQMEYEEVQYWEELKQIMIEACDTLTVLADSDKVGELLLVSDDGKQIFVMGHLEYDRLTLDYEYKRDSKKGLNPDLPENYYPDDDSSQRPLLRWRGASNALFSNWVNYYVYQNTPYEWS